MPDLGEGIGERDWVVPGCQKEACRPGRDQHGEGVSAAQHADARLPHLLGPGRAHPESEDSGGDEHGSEDCGAVGRQEATGTSHHRVKSGTMP